MSTGKEYSELQGAARINQVIVGTLCLGVVGFIGLVLAIGLGMPEGAPRVDQPAALGLPPITLAAVLTGAVCLVASFLAPKLVTEGRLRELARGKTTIEPAPSGDGDAETPTAAEDLLRLFQTQLILGAALAEGGAFFAVVAYMLEHHNLALVTAFVLLTALFLKFPTTDRVASWLDERRGALKEMRQAVP